jgi:hypothetical protein
VTTFKFFARIVLFMELCLVCSCHSADSPSHPPAVEPAASLSSSHSHELIRHIDGLTTEGKPLSFDFEHQEKGTLLLVMSPSCPYCRINFHNWRSLLNSPTHATVVWVDVSDSATEEYRKVFGLNERDEIVRISTDNNKTFPFWSTPTTALIAPDGHLQWSHEGVLNSADVAWLKNRLQAKGGG